MPTLTQHRFPALILSLLTPLVPLAAEDLVNSSVLPEMNGGDSTYLFDDYTVNWGQMAVSIGNTTSNNTFTIENGGSLTNSGSTSGPGIHSAIGRTFGSNNNKVVIKDVGSSWTFTGGSYYIGLAGESNRLEIIEGATLNTRNGVIGAGVLSTPGRGINNSVLIDGAGSTWNTTTSVNVGSYGSSNTLTVSNAGALNTTTSFVVGNGNSSHASEGSNNSAIITGAFSTLAVTERVTIGNNGSDNVLTIAAGATASSQQLHVGYGGSVNPNLGLRNSLVVTGAESSYTNRSDIWLGYRGSNNSITVENGARLSNDDSPVTGDLLVGRGNSTYLTMGRQNSAIVQGSGSVWNNSGTVVVGEYGSENTVIVRDGGTFTSAALVMGQYAVTVGGVTTGMDNEFLVTGADSVWQNAGNVTIGNDDNSGNSGNRLVVQDHGLAMIGDDLADTITVAAGNHIRLDGGYIALFGDQQAVVSALIDAGAFQILQGGVWTDATASDIQFAYFANGADTSSFTNGYYDNLGGYTVVTAVPEPSTAILLFGASVVGLWMLRRRSARA